MKYVIHKFVLRESTNTIQLEADAVVLYADRDSREQTPAIWVARRSDWSERPGGRRTFRVVGTGEPFDTQLEAVGVPRMYGPVRLGEFIFHVFEVGS